MPRGRPRKDGAVEMSESEVDSMESSVQVVGSLKPQKIDDKEKDNRLAAQKIFPNIRVSQENWIVVTQEELEKYEKEGRLAGYDPATRKALITK